MLLSRKVLLAIVALIHTAVGYYFGIPEELLIAIDGVLVAVILGIAHEDAAAKSSPTLQQAENIVNEMK